MSVDSKERERVIVWIVCPDCNGSGLNPFFRRVKGALMPAYKPCEKCGMLGKIPSPEV